VHQAVSRLGVELLKALALSVHAFGTLKAPPVKGFSLEQLQQHSLLTARVGKCFVPDIKRAGEVFSAALMHDVGKLVLAVGAPELFAEVVNQHVQTRRPYYLLERELLGVTHAEVGAYLLGYWGLPLPLVEAIAFHHTPSMVAEGAADTLAAVHVADALVDNPVVNDDPGRDGLLDLAFIERAGLAGKLAEWRAQAAILLQKQ
jgi:HD-like signal output (HDOD) protein